MSFGNDTNTLISITIQSASTILILCVMLYHKVLTEEDNKYKALMIIMKYLLVLMGMFWLISLPSLLMSF